MSFLIFLDLDLLGDLLLVVSLHLLELDLKVFDILLQIDLPFRRLFMLLSFLLLQLAVQIGGFILLEGHIFDSGLLVGVALLEEQKALLLAEVESMRAEAESQRSELQATSSVRVKLTCP